MSKYVAQVVSGQPHWSDAPYQTFNVYKDGNLIIQVSGWVNDLGLEDLDFVDRWPNIPRGDRGKALKAALKAAWKLQNT